jgi:hypothetical protein
MKNLMLATGKTGASAPLAAVSSVASAPWPGLDRRTFGLVWVILVLAVSLLLPVASRAQGTGSLQVQLVNGTPGGTELGVGIPVVLHIYQGGTEVETRETLTEADGSFQFDGLDTGPDLEYWPEVRYQDSFFTSAEPFQFADGQTALSGTLTVYETTNDDSAIRLDSVHVIAESFGEVLRISEIHLFGNGGDKAFIGNPEDSEQGMTVFIPLPENAVGLSFGEGVAEDQYIQVEGGLMGTEPVPPGTETALAFFSYHLMVTGESVPLEQRFAYPVTNMNMLVAQPGLTLNSDQLQSRGLELFQGRQYELYSTQNLGPEISLALEFIPVTEVSGDTGALGSPASSGAGMTGATPRGNQLLILWIGVGLAVLAVAGVVVYSMAAGPPAVAAAGRADLASNPKARGQLAALADLEDAFEAGQVNEVAYERRRAELYEEIRSL